MLIQLDVNIPAPLAPIFLPNNPDIIALNKGINNTNIYMVYTRHPAPTVAGNS